MRANVFCVIPDIVLCFMYQSYDILSPPYGHTQISPHPTMSAVRSSLSVTLWYKIQNNNT
nr:MAG TPA: hypothetical protein [Caudoviricetes sp.]